jgi:hypothetical protein
MVKKKDEKKGKIDFKWAQFSAYPILGNTGEKVGAEIGSFSDVKSLDTEHSKRDTKIKIGPAEPSSLGFRV